MSSDDGAIRKVDLKHENIIGDKLAFVLHNVFTKEECDEIIAITEEKGYEPAMVNVGGGRQKLMTDIRNSYRCIWDTTEQAERIWQRIKKFVPEYWEGHRALGLNERLRILRYDPGQKFAPHFDGEYRRDNGERSYITMQLYLNEGFKGGSTTFLEKWDPSSGDSVPVVPKTGSILVFQHDILHEGSELKDGRKYTIRSDVMFTKDRYDRSEDCK
ncbi:uncharacterized protein LOC135492322 isoform X2 [Lineus longissimus]